MNKTGFSLGFVLILGWVLGAASFSSASIPPVSKIHRLNRLGHIQVGDPIDHLPSILAEKKQFQLKKLSPRFHVYLFAPELPSKCMNLQCGAFARQIVSHGGFLVGGGDRHFVQDVGEVNRRTPVVLVTDRADKVVAIYENATTADLGKIVAEVK